jgi:hypothetical protein
MNDKIQCPCIGCLVGMCCSNIDDCVWYKKYITLLLFINPSNCYPITIKEEEKRRVEVVSGIEKMLEVQFLKCIDNKLVINKEWEI